MKVAVYFNLHRKLFSVVAKEGDHKGRVIGHCTHVALEGVTFRVSEAGRQRVLREQKKNVHAKVHGTLLAWANGSTRGLNVALPQGLSSSPDCVFLWGCTQQDTQVTYNPYKYSTFVAKRDEAPALAADAVTITPTGMTARNVH